MATREPSSLAPVPPGGVVRPFDHMLPPSVERYDAAWNHVGIRKPGQTLSEGLTPGQVFYSTLAGITSRPDASGAYNDYNQHVRCYDANGNLVAAVTTEPTAKGPFAEVLDVPVSSPIAYRETEDGPPVPLKLVFKPYEQTYHVLSGEEVQGGSWMQAQIDDPNSPDRELFGRYAEGLWARIESGEVKLVRGYPQEGRWQRIREFGRDLLRLGRRA